MTLREKVAQLPTVPGVYLYKDAAGKVLYVGKAKSLRSRVRSYFSDDRLADVKTGTLIREARDIDYILVDNEKEALALENNLIKQYKPRFNILLRDDKTYPVHQADRREISARVRHAAPAQGRRPPTSARTSRRNLAHRLVHFIHRHFQVPSCKVDLTRYHPQPVPAVPHPPLPGAVRAGSDHRRSLRRGGPRRAPVPRRPAQGPGGANCGARMETASERHALRRGGRRCATCSPPWRRSEQRQKMAAAEGDDADIFALLRRAAAGGASICSTCATGSIVDRREFFWEDQHEFDPPEFFSVAAQADLPGPAVHPGAPSTCRWSSKIAKRWRNCSREKRGRKVEIHTPQRGQKKAHAGAGGDQRQAQLRRALPRAEAVVESDPGGAAGCAEPGRARRSASSASTSRTSRAPTKWPAWWCGKTAG